MKQRRNRLKVEIVAPDNQRKISKYGNGPDWVFNMSSLMQVGPKKKMTTPITGTLQWAAEKPHIWHLLTALLIPLIGKVVRGLLLR